VALATAEAATGLAAEAWLGAKATRLAAEGWLATKAALFTKARLAAKARLGTETWTTFTLVVVMARLAVKRCAAVFATVITVVRAEAGVFTRGTVAETRALIALMEAAVRCGVVMATFVTARAAK